VYFRCWPSRGKPRGSTTCLLAYLWPSRLVCALIRMRPNIPYTVQNMEPRFVVLFPTWLKAPQNYSLFQQFYNILDVLHPLQRVSDAFFINTHNISVLSRIFRLNFLKSRDRRYMSRSLVICSLLFTHPPYTDSFPACCQRKFWYFAVRRVETSHWMFPFTQSDFAIIRDAQCHSQRFDSMFWGPAAEVVCLVDSFCHIH
jgi:hypothetical protein